MMCCGCDLFGGTSSEVNSKKKPSSNVTDVDDGGDEIEDNESIDDSEVIDSNDDYTDNGDSYNGGDSEDNTSSDKNGSSDNNTSSKNNSSNKDNTSSKNNSFENKTSTDDSNSTDDNNSDEDNTSAGDNGKKSEVTSSTTRVVKKGSVELSGDISETYIVNDDEDDEDQNYADQVVEKSTVKTLSTKWDSQTLSHLKTSTDALADTMRKKVVNAKNTNYNVTGTTYYISPDGDDNNDGKSKDKPIKTTTALVGISLKKGDAVLFERGGVWRLSRAIMCEEGVTYGAYGDESKDKPAIYGSMYNYADKEFWKQSNLKNVWKLAIRDTSIGLVVFNHGELVGKMTRKGLLALTGNGDFYYNAAMGTLYLYCDKGNPGKVYNDIEVCLNKAAFDVNRVSGVTIDNFKVKYFGRLGIDLAAADNSVVRNCEVGFIGGASQNSTTRLGNAIQMWQGCDGHLVENCWMYQIYDTGLTFQGDSINPTTRAKQGSHDEDYKNITYRNNLIEYCVLSIELWHGNHNSGDNKSWRYTDAVLQNIHIENNVSRMAGYGWSSFPGQRPDHHGEHIIMYARAFPYADKVYIEDNIFDLCDAWICRWEFTTDYAVDTNPATRRPIDIVNKNGIWVIRNNTYYHGKNKTGGIMWYGSMKTGSGQSKLEELVGQFDSSPKLVTWISE